jgi:hypothetical protein
MKKIVSALAGISLLGALAVPAQAQNAVVQYKATATTPGSIPVTPTTPLPVVQVPSASGGLAPSPAAPALATSQVIKASAGNLYSFEVSADSTLSGAAWWILIFDAATDPGNGAVTPRKCYAQVSGATSASYAWFTPIAFTTGIVIVVSTTGCYTETQSAHAFISGDAK